ncbi:MAG: hypothetical protein K6C94_05760 [Candidatus Gastranaerophilales bacterium]|nr:hypothetical protein [Candidatus Gastranaerophilales bacterium]
MDFLTASLQIKSMSIFEVGMMLCFGASWPFMIRKTLVTKLTKGQSKRFLSIILAGYICGMFHKMLYNMDIVFWLYVINFALVAFELILTFVYGKEKEC